MFAPLTEGHCNYRPPTANSPEVHRRRWIIWGLGRLLCEDLFLPSELILWYSTPEYLLLNNSHRNYVFVFVFKLLCVLLRWVFLLVSRLSPVAAGGILPSCGVQVSQAVCFLVKHRLYRAGSVVVV